VPDGVYATATPPDDIDPRIEALVNDLIGQVADKWTIQILEVLTEKGESRFTRISEVVPGISQKMLTQTLRHMEREGLVTRTVHPVVPPKVEYKLTPLFAAYGYGPRKISNRSRTRAALSTTRPGLEDKG
jgi:DNA-binding HxlR family transcriptional regulator